MNVDSKSMKLNYQTPVLERVVLDTEISLILGTPAPGDPESMMIQTEFVLEQPLMNDITIIGL